MSVCTSVFIICLLCICSHFGACQEQFVICIGNKKPANKNIRCTSTYQNLSDADIEVSIKNSTEVIFTDTESIIHETTIIKNREYIKFIGSYDNVTNVSTYLRCDHTIDGIGLYFKHVVNLVIENLTVINCGGRFEVTKEEHYQVTTAVFLRHCRNVSINNLTVKNSAATGITMLNCLGTVQVTKSSFKNNTNSGVSLNSNGGGLYIVMSTETEKAAYQIENCQFLDNSIISQNKYNQSFNELLGGGVGFLTTGNTSNVTFHVSNCLVSGNSADYGGGVHILIYQNSTNIKVFLKHLNVSMNQATSSGGGLDVAIYVLRSVEDYSGYPRNNNVSIEHCNFEDNEAGFKGGGAAFFSSLLYSINPHNYVTFKNCTWKRNTAKIGSGLSIIPTNITHVFNTLAPSITLSDAVFQYNKVKGIINKLETTLYSRLIPFVVKGTIIFNANRGSGISLVDSSINVKQSANVTFVDNHGSFGGGIFMIGLSKIIVEGDVSMRFINNRANFRGGAIFFYSLHELFSVDTHLCFIQHSFHLTSTSSWPKFYFKNNKAVIEDSHSIFVSSLTTCNCPLNPSPESLTSVFENCIGTFSFHEGNITSQVATVGSEFSITSNDSFHAIPGKTTQLPFSIHDQLGHNATVLLLLAINNRNEETSSSLSLTNSITATSEAVFKGITGDEGRLQINSLFQNLTMELNITISECPPGYVNVNGTCLCSAQVPDKQYQSVIHCDYNNDMRSYIINGFWAGYVTDEGGSDNQPGEDNFYVSQCPFGYCYDISDNSDEVSYETPLVDTASQEQLDEIICQRQKRTGILCGRCLTEHTIYYHSRKYRCNPIKNYCNYGILIYILSEIVPVTFLFTFVILKGVNFNSGSLNGFVLFAQLIQSIAIVANGTITYKKAEFFVYELIILLYEPFNLNFFEAEALSFCIYKRANFLVIIFIKFVTLLYSLALVIVLVYIMRCRYCYKLQISCFKIGITKTSSMTSGIAAFFTLCYSNATRLSFDILNAGQLIGKGELPMSPLRVFRMGNVVYFTGVHIPFAIGAVLILVTIVLIPPLFLLIYPVGVTILPEKVQRFSCFRYILWKAGLYMALFDSFQGCFKDKHRYFAGLYFLYRSAFLATFAYLQSTIIFLLINQMIISTVLALHLWVQPYKKAMHNLIDGGLFLTLAMINLLTIWRYFQTFTGGRDIEILSVGIIQLILLFIPALVFGVYTLYLISSRIRICKIFTQSLQRSTSLSPSTAASLTQDDNYYSSLDDIDSRMKDRS